MGKQPISNPIESPVGSPKRRIWLFRAFLLLVLLSISVMGWYVLRLQADQPAPKDVGLLAMQQATTPPIEEIFSTPEVSYSDTPLATRTTLEGSLVFTQRQGGYSHIWAYAAGDPESTRLTWGAWDDRDPAVDPTGEFLAFSSNRNGPWDLYLLDMRTGEIRQLTSTPGYEGHPTWSPDGVWIAFEAYYDGDFDIRILSVNGDQDPIQLTDHPGSDTAPAWDPAGRRIAFVSDREGSPDIFVANLDQPDNRYINLTQSPSIPENYPRFNPDSTWLAYTQKQDSITEIYLKDLSDTERPPLPLGAGEYPTWSPDGTSIAAILRSAQRSHLVRYAVGGPLPLTGFSVADPVYQLDWSAHGLPGDVAGLVANAEPLTSLYEPDTNPSAGQVRTILVNLPGVQAPHPQLSDAVDEAFNALKIRVATQLGWDFLATLEHAFLGINDPLPPGLSYDDWLYTGRAFAFNGDAVEADFVVIVREDIAGQTYWRIFVRTAQQDGTQGEPLREYAWDFSTRFEGDPQAYDQGGSVADHLAQGYFLDFTQLALDYGFERVPALPNWRTYYPGTRFNEFVYRQGLDWLDAMLELYPLSAIVTPTPFHTPTPTPTRTLRPTPTPWWWRWETPTPSQTPFIPPTPTP